MKEVLETLKNMNINYKIVNHPPAYTTELADEYVSGHEGVLSKTLFLAGKKDRNYYLIILDDHKKVDLKQLGQLTNDRLHFASEEALQNKMQLKPGIVSLFGLINNKEKDIQVYIDKELLNEKANEIQADIIEMETMPDHVHLLISCDPQFGIHRVVKQLKGHSASVLRKEFPHLKSTMPSMWTNSYFCSTVGSVSLEVVKQYIENQKTRNE